MKRILFILLMFVSFVSTAQNHPQQSFEFYYIAHDRTTPVNDLCARLESVYELALELPDMAVIFYLPNCGEQNEPLVVKINLEGDNRNDFKTIISELRLKSAHDIYADIDYACIVDLINQHDFITETGAPVYSSVTFYWYVNPDFWQFQYNEKLIATLYFNLELDRYPNYVTTNILHATGDGLRINKEHPFGTKNLCKSMFFLLQEY